MRTVAVAGALLICVASTADAQSLNFDQAAYITCREAHAMQPEARKALDSAAKWCLACRNKDGGFGHFPGSTSDADANFFHIGTLIMAGFLKPADPLPPDAHLLGWGHLFPVRK